MALASREDESQRLTAAFCAHVHLRREAPARPPQGFVLLTADGTGCVLTTTGRIFCWGGYNFSGELGNGTVTPFSLSAEIFEIPAPVVPPRP